MSWEDSQQMNEQHLEADYNATAPAGDDFGLESEKWGWRERVKGDSGVSQVIPVSSTVTLHSYLPETEAGPFR